MGLRRKLSGIGRALGSTPHADGEAELHVGDPRFDNWEVVRDFEDLDAARAFRQHLDERGLDSVLTADWPLDEFGRGDIALRVPAGSWSDAEEALDEP
jgi:hypothetical protein